MSGFRGSGTCQNHTNKLCMTSHQLHTWRMLVYRYVSVSNGEKTPLTPEELIDLKEHIRGGHLTKSLRAGHAY
eukprot:3632650-Amphidinium_carterae.1